MFICLVPVTNHVEMAPSSFTSQQIYFVAQRPSSFTTRQIYFVAQHPPSYTMINTCFHISNRPWREEPGNEFRSRISTVQAALPIFLDRLFTCQFYGLIPPIDSFFPWNVKYKTIKVLQVCSTSRHCCTVCKSLFYILTYLGTSSYGSKSIVPCVTLFP